MDETAQFCQLEGNPFLHVLDSVDPSRDHCFIAGAVAGFLSLSIPPFMLQAAKT